MFHWVSGNDKLKQYMADNGTTRTFCSYCGSSLTFSSQKTPEEVIEIALGTLDGKLPIEPDAHIFVSSGASWTVLSDDLPQYTEGRDSARIHN